MLAHSFSRSGEIFHERYHKLRDIPEERIIGFDILVKALHDEAGECGLLLCEIDDLLPQLDVGTYSNDDIFDEIVAVPEPFIF